MQPSAVDNNQPWYHRCEWHYSYG